MHNMTDKEDFFLLQMRYSSPLSPPHHGLYYLGYTLSHRPTLCAIAENDLPTQLQYCWFRVHQDSSTVMEHVLSSKFISLQDNRLLLDARPAATPLVLIGGEMSLPDASKLALVLNPVSMSLEVAVGGQTCTTLPYAFRPTAWTGAICQIALASCGFFLSGEETCLYTDVNVAGAYWTFLGKEVTQGEALISGNQYYLRNLTQGKLLSYDNTLTSDNSQACLYTLDSGEVGKPLGPTFTLISPSGPVSHNSTLADSAAMKVMFPKPYSSEIVTRFTISAGFQSSFELQYPSDIWEMYQLIGLRESLSRDKQDLDEETEYLNHSDNVDFCLDIEQDITSHAQSLAFLYSHSSLDSVPLYSLLNIPLIATRIYLQLLALQEADIPPALYTITTDTAFPAIASALLQLLSYSRAACFQANTLSTAIVQAVYSEPIYTPQIFARAQSVLSPSIDLAGMVTSFRSWLDAAAFPQVLPLEVMRKLTGTMFGSRKEWKQYATLLTGAPNFLMSHAFQLTESGPVLSIDQATGLPVLISLESAALPQEFATYVTKFINLVTSLNVVSDFQARKVAFPQLNLTEDLLESLIRSSKVNISIRTAAAKARISQISIHSPVEKSIMRGYTVALEKPRASLGLELDCLTAELGSEAKNRLKFAVTLLKSASSVLVCSQVRAEEVSGLMAYIGAVWLPSDSTPWLKAAIQDFASHQGLESSHRLKKAVAVTCSLISAVLTLEEQTMAKSLFPTQATRPQLNCSHLSHRSCRKVLLRMLELAAEHRIPVKERWRRLLGRTMDPASAVLETLQCMADYPEAELTRVFAILCPTEREKAGVLEVGKEANLEELVHFLRLCIGKRLGLLSNPVLRPHIQLLFRETKWYRYFVGYWVRVYSRIYENPSANEALISDLHQMGSALFRLFQGFIEKNDINKELIRRKLNPLLYYLSIAEQAELIRDLNDFSHYSASHIPHFLHHLLTNYSPKGVKTGAYLWVETIVSNTDGSVKAGLQAALYTGLAAEWGETKAWAAVGMKLLGVCCVGNEGIRAKCKLVLSINAIMNIYKGLKGHVALEAALFAFVHIHADISPSKAAVAAATSLLSDALDVIETVPRLPNLRAVLHSGLYEQVKEPDSVNFASCYGSEADQKAVNALRIVSSGRFVGLRGGLVALAPSLLACVRGDKKGERLSQRVNEALRTVKVTIKSMLQSKKQPILLELEAFTRSKRLETSHIPNIPPTRPKLAFSSALIELNASELPRVLAWTYESKAWKHCLAASLLECVQSSMAQASTCVQVAVDTLAQGWDPEVCGPLWEVLCALGSVDLSDSLCGRMGAWLVQASAIEVRIRRGGDLDGAVQSMKIGRLVSSAEFRPLVEQFPAVYVRAVQWVLKLSPLPECLQAILPTLTQV